MKIRKLVSQPTAQGVADSAVWGLEEAESLLIVRMTPKPETVDGESRESSSQWLVYHRNQMAESGTPVPGWLQKIIDQGRRVGAEDQVTQLVPDKQFGSLGEIKLALQISQEAAS